MVWSRLIYPDGSAVELGGMPGADQVDHHCFRGFGSTLLPLLVPAGFEIATDEGNDRRWDESNTLREALAPLISQVAGHLFERNLDIQPKSTIRYSQIVSVTVHKDLSLRPRQT